MTGMGRGLSSNDPTVVSAFQTTLIHQLLIIVGLLTLLAIVWNGIRSVQYRRGAAPSSHRAARSTIATRQEAPARRVLRIGFGLFWLLDGILQTQTAMPLGLPSNVLTPGSASSPTWIQHVVNVGVTIWSDHPVSAAASVVWIQVGIGLLLLVASTGRWSRAAGAISAGWGVVVWVFGEALGGIFGHGASWLFGAPGAALFYVAAGVLLALPERLWVGERLGKIVVKTMGAFFVLMGILQAWPGRGSWSGGSTASSGVGTLRAMTAQMAQVPQPGISRSLVTGFGSFDAAHGWAVNLVVVMALLSIGTLLLSGVPQLLRVAVLVGLTLCVADWIFVQDLGFFGGLGTDPNSMPPMALLLVTGYLAIVRLPEPAEEPAPDAPPLRSIAAQVERLSPSLLLRSIAALGAIGIVLVGAAPMAVSAANRNADPILTEAANGTPNLVSQPTRPFTLVEQNGRLLNLHDLRGKTIVLSFLDPVCTSDCPLIAQELRITDLALGAERSKVIFVSVVDNPIYRSRALVRSFDRQEGLDRLGNWQLLTGPLPALRRVWGNYGIQVAVASAGAMVAHNDLVYVIDPTGKIRVVLGSDPGSASATALHNSFSSLLGQEIQRYLPT